MTTTRKTSKRPTRLCRSQLVDLFRHADGVYRVRIEVNGKTKERSLRTADDNVAATLLPETVTDLEGAGEEQEAGTLSAGPRPPGTHLLPARTPGPSRPAEAAGGRPATERCPRRTSHPLTLGAHATLRIADTDQLNRMNERYPIATYTGTLSGRIRSNNLPAGWVVRDDMQAEMLFIGPPSGTRIRIF